MGVTLLHNRELVEAAFVTTSSTLGVLLMICATQRDATRKASDGLQRVIEFYRLPVFEDLSGLSYLCAYAKGVFRWRAVTPLGGLRVVTDDEYMAILFRQTRKFAEMCGRLIWTVQCLGKRHSGLNAE